MSRFEEFMKRSGLWQSTGAVTQLQPEASALASGTAVKTETSADTEPTTRFGRFTQEYGLDIKAPELPRPRAFSAPTQTPAENRAAYPVPTVNTAPSVANGGTGYSAGISLATGAQNQAVSANGLMERKDTQIRLDQQTYDDFDRDLLQPIRQLQDSLVSYAENGGFAEDGRYQQWRADAGQIQALIDGRRNEYQGNAEAMKALDEVSDQLAKLIDHANGQRVNGQRMDILIEGVRAGNLLRDDPSREDANDLRNTYYSSLFYRDDFETASKHERRETIPFAADATAMDGWDEKTLREYLSSTPSGEDLLYETVNGNYAAAVTLGSVNYRSNSIWDGMADQYKNSMGSGMLLYHLTDEERAIFNYTYKQSGLGAAKAFLNYLAADLAARNRLAYESARAAEAKAHPVLSSISTVIEAPFQALINAPGAIADSVDGKLQENASYMYGTYKKNAIRNAVTEEIDSDFGKWAYQSGMSIADSATRTALSFGNPIVSSAMVATDTYESGLVSGQDRKLEDWQTIALAGISSVAEIGAERIKFDKLFNNENLTKATVKKYILENMATEGLEEMTTESINLMADIIISQDKSQWQAAIDAYKAEGKSDSAAWMLALKDQGVAILEAGVGGAISGGVMSGGTAGISYLSGTMPDSPAQLPKVEAAVNSEYQKRVEEAKDAGGPVDSLAIYNAVMDDLSNGKLTGYELSAEEMAETWNGYQQALAAVKAESNTPTVPHDRKTASTADSENATPPTGPINMDDVIDESIAQLTGAPADPVSAALDTVKAGGTVSNNQARDILNNTRAIRYLQEKTGMKLTDDRSGGTASSRRAAVKEAIAQLAAMEQTETVDTAPGSGYDNTNATGGNLYDAGQTQQEVHISHRRGETSLPEAQGDTSAEAGNRPGVPGEMGENHGTFTQIRSDWGQRDGLTRSQEPYALEDYIQPEEGSSLQQTQNGFSEQGIDCKVVRADKWSRKNPAFTRAGKVYISDGIDADTLKTAIPHEKSHVMRQTEFAPYLDFVSRTPDLLNVDSESYQMLLDMVANHTGIDIFSMDDGQFIHFYDELNAIVYGMQKTGILADSAYPYGDFIPGAFTDFDGYIRELDSIHEQFAQRSTSTTPTTSVGAAPADFSGKAVYNDLLREGNVQPDRPGDVRPMEVPKTDAYGRHVSETAANLYGAEITSDDAASQIEDLIAEGALGFDVKTNRQMLSDAAAEIKKDGLAKSERNVNKAVFSGKAKDSDIAKAMLLYASYANRTSPSAQDKAAELMVDLATMANDAGRRLQLFSLLRKLTPEGQLKTVEKGVQRAVDNINKKRGKKNQAEVTIPQELVDDYLDAAKKDAEEKTDDAAKAKEDAEKAIYKAAAAQIDASPMEKLNAWRYMAMLGNVKTQARNFIGNAAFRPMVSIKRTVGAVLEAAFVEKDKRTKSILGIGKEYRSLVSWAMEDAKTQTADEMLSYCAQTGDAARTEIDENRKIFDTKWLEGVREFVQKVPEGADMIFKHWEYSRSLASFVKARGYTADDVSSGSVPQDVLTAARTYAAQEALKATFNDHNAVSDFLSKRYRRDNAFGKAMNILAEGILPFRRTPANILVRSVEYSPLRLLKSVTYDVAKVRSGDMTGAQYIDGLASGITGTAAMVLGYALCSGIFGIRLRGKVDDEDELRQGHQSYALEIGGKSYTIDWLAPTNIPLFVGANLYESTHGQTDAGWLASTIDAVGSSFEPMLELSCLSSLSDMLESVKYAGDGEPLWTIAATAATSYLNQYIPTLFGQVEQATESSKQMVYSDADTALGRFAERAIGKFTQRIPGVDLFQAKKYDAWGREVETSGWLESFVSPTYVSDITDDPVDNEISRLNKAQDENISPSLPSKTFTINGEEIRLSDDQYETLCRVQGENQRRLVEDIMALEEYEGLTDDEKAAVVSKAYDYARELSKSSIDVDGKIPAYITNRPEGMSEAEAILRQAVAGTTTKYADVPVEIADKVVDLLDGLTVETKPDGTSYTSVRPIQRMEAVVESDELDPYVEKLLPAYMDQNSQKRYQTALDEGYTSDEFVAAYRIYLDKEKGESKTQLIRQMAEELDVDFRTAKRLYEIYSEKPSDDE